MLPKLHLHRAVRARPVHAGLSLSVSECCHAPTHPPAGRSHQVNTRDKKPFRALYCRSAEEQQGGTSRPPLQIRRRWWPPVAFGRMPHVHVITKNGHGRLKGPVAARNEKKQWSRPKPRSRRRAQRHRQNLGGAR